MANEFNTRGGRPTSNRAVNNESIYPAVNNLRSAQRKLFYFLWRNLFGRNPKQRKKESSEISKNEENGSPKVPKILQNGWKMQP